MLDAFGIFLRDSSKCGRNRGNSGCPGSVVDPGFGDISIFKEVVYHFFDVLWPIILKSDVLLGFWVRRTLNWI